MHTLTVIGGEHRCHELTQFGAVGLAEIHAGLAALLLLLDAVEHLTQGYLLVVGVHGNVCQRHHLIGGEHGHALGLCLQCLYDETAIAMRYQSVKAWLA